MKLRGFPGGPVVKSPSANAGDTGSIPGPGTMIPQAVRRLSLYTAATEACVLQSSCSAPREAAASRETRETSCNLKTPAHFRWRMNNYQHKYIPHTPYTYPTKRCLSEIHIYRHTRSLGLFD